MRILIADDHALVRRGVREALAEEFAQAEFGEAATVQETLREVLRRDWDIVVLDITMPGGSGLDVLKHLKRTHPDLPVLVLSMHPADQYAAHVLQAGAAGYLTKEAAPEKLVTAVRTILAGRRYPDDASPDGADPLAR